MRTEHDVHAHAVNHGDVNGGLDCAQPGGKRRSLERLRALLHAGEEVSERTICVHSRAVRWGKDGVGLQFVLQKDSEDPSMAAADRKALDRFLQRLRKSRR